MVKVEAPFGVPDVPQPASATNTSTAAARPRRVRKRRSERNRSNISIAANTGATKRMEMGRMKMGRTEVGGGTTNDVVVSVSAAVALDPAGGVTDAGAMAQVDFKGSPVQASATAELKAPMEVTVTVSGSLEPFLTVSVDGALTLKSGATAPTVPLRVMVCVPAPSMMVSVPASAVATEGV